MKIYTQTYDISQPTEQRFWVAPFSNFKIGLKVTDKGEEVLGAISLMAGSTALSAEENEIDGFTIFPTSSTSAGSTTYTISAEGVEQTLSLVQVTTGSTVFDVDEAGGGDMSNYYTKSETSSAVEIGTALEGKQPTGDYALTSQIPTVNDGTLTILQGGVQKGTFTANQSGNVSVELDAGGGGGSAISAFDMSENPVQSKAIVEAALNSNTCLPQTIAKYTDDSISALNIAGALNSGNTDLSTNLKKVLIGTNVTSIGNKAFANRSNLLEVVVPNSVSSYDMWSFERCPNLSSIQQPEYMSSIGDQTFKNCTALKTMALPKGPTYLPTQFLGSCSNFGPSLKVPDTYTTIGANAFLGCNSLKIVDFGNTRTSIPTLVNANAFPSSISIYVPDALYDQWIAASNWSTISSQIHSRSDLEAPTKVTNLSSVSGIMKISQADYDVLSAGGTADASTLYVIV